MNPINPFGVSIEMVENGYPRFLSNSPYMTLQREPPNNVPWMVGVNDQLGLWAASSMSISSAATIERKIYEITLH